MVCRRVLISGKVQGVSFRFHTREQAIQLKLKGFVRNLDDGRVEVVAAGEPASVERLVAWVKIGPPAAKVEDVTVSEMKDGFPQEPFYIRREGGKF